MNSQHKSIIKNLKKIIVQSAYSAGEGHIPSAFSILDILWVLYDKVLKINPKKPEDPNRDFFVLSKGQASLALYVVLAQKGFFLKKEFDRYCAYDSILGGHPDRLKVPGIEASTGSLGHGFPMAFGIALGNRIQGRDNKTYCLIGDGEANEGTVWETALLAAHHNLHNFVCVVDYNHSGDRALSVGSLLKKFKAFEWNTLEIDGHNPKEILSALTSFHEKKPTAIIANTIKGKGVHLMENEHAWHHRAPNAEELEQILKELN